MREPTDEPAANEWEYDVRERVANAVGCIEARDGDMGTLLHLRWQLKELMDIVKMADLTAPELIAIIAVLAPANGRRLVTEVLEEGIRPILRLIGGSGGDSAADLSEQDADLLNDIAGGDTVQPVP